MVLSLHVRFIPLLEEVPGKSELKSNLTESNRMAQQGSLEVSASRLHLEQVFHLTSPVLAPTSVLHPEHLTDLHLLDHCVEFLSLQLVVQARHPVPVRSLITDATD